MCLVTVYAQASYQRPTITNSDVVAAVLPVAAYELGARFINPKQPMTWLSRGAEVSSAVTAALALRSYGNGNSKTAAFWGLTSVGTTGMGLWCRYNANQRARIEKSNQTNNTGGSSN